MIRATFELADAYIQGVRTRRREAVKAMEAKREERLEKEDQRERARIAELFNNRYAYCVPYVDDKRVIGPGVGIFGVPFRRGFRWMCPDCNRIHEPASGESFTGLWYPKCCKWPEFYRHGDAAGLVPSKLLYKRTPRHKYAKPIPYTPEEKA